MEDEDGFLICIGAFSDEMADELENLKGNSRNISLVEGLVAEIYVGEEREYLVLNGAILNRKTEEAWDFNPQAFVKGGYPKLEQLFISELCPE